ncbi:MAG: HIT family protein [Candidatus Lloydbacteria bacterium CG22_combo_CG10-13_8_21_14_all_47_15]|uniref:HIT family protein n=1 Tax=Candidatus Lloydbacteria bacterium CG22_combo_CG10-13_8_21_14_all_47_15 TaxID=1974635 RepID=A0A2H0CTW9_9BACT|nr:MAG: HIT family protein [Candidatus Lloydbacteria bacterium CG22_combo_CG10-13_8_21_14_all_47_15]
MKDCLFCKIIVREIPAEIVYEDDFSIAFLDNRPINPGHTLLVPKEHHENLYDMPDTLLAKFAPNIKKLARAIKKGLSADGTNIGINNDSSAGQVIFHHHTHIIPRFANDGHRHWKGAPYENKDAETETAQKIKSMLS